MVLKVCYLWHCGAQTLCICTLPSGPPSELPWSSRSAISGIVVLKLCASVLYPLALLQSCHGPQGLLSLALWCSNSVHLYSTLSHYTMDTAHTLCICVQEVYCVC